MEKWNGKISSLTVSPESSPELYEELSRITHRERSARLRTLALIGLFALRNQSAAHGVVQPAEPTNTVDDMPKAETVSSRLENKKFKLAEKLRSSVQSSG